MGGGRAQQCASLEVELVTEIRILTCSDVDQLKFKPT